MFLKLSFIFKKGVTILYKKKKEEESLQILYFNIKPINENWLMLVIYLCMNSNYYINFLFQQGLLILMGVRFITMFLLQS